MEGLAVSTVATILWHPSEICLTDGVAVAETENNRWAKGASRAKYTVRHYGRNYSVITEQSECGRLRFYATIESLYGANRFTVTVRKRNGNFSMTLAYSVFPLVWLNQGGPPCLPFSNCGFS